MVNLPALNALSGRFLTLPIPTSSRMAPVRLNLDMECQSISQESQESSSWRREGRRNSRTILKNPSRSIIIDQWHRRLNQTNFQTLLNSNNAKNLKNPSVSPILPSDANPVDADSISLTRVKLKKLMTAELMTAKL